MPCHSPVSIRKTVFCLNLFGILLLLAAPARAQYSVLYNFAGATSDGQNPNGSLILSGSTLYGMSDGGGSNFAGTIFSESTSGGSDTILHSFGGAGDGEIPHASLILSGSTLYGTTDEGGSGSSGTVFSESTSGGADTILHSFGGASDGIFPEGSLILSGSTLYGTTSDGGANDSDGTIFSESTSGGADTILHSFGAGTDGAQPRGSLILSGSMLYGTTFYGGNFPLSGTIFSESTSGGADTVLHSFSPNGGDGENPAGSLILSGATLYGMTTAGGSHGDGAIFSESTTGGSDTILYSFAGGVSDGKDPNGSLILSGSILYGMTETGGANGDGTIFSFDLNTDAETILHSFDGTDGQNPYGDLLLVGNTLYGMTSGGGTDSHGVIFTLDVPEPSTLSLLSLGTLSLLSRRRNCFAGNRA